MREKYTLEKPEPDSQFRLLPCKACKAGAAYQIGQEARKPIYRVKCGGCGQVTPWWPCRHDAQIDWNSRLGEGFR